MSTQYYDLKVREVVQETADAISIVFEQPENRISYKSGQFLTLIDTIDGKEVRRAYSLCSSPVIDKDILAVSVKRVENGLMSNHLNSQVKAGHQMRIMEPLGNFTTGSSASPRHLVLLGGGSGITPLFSILRTVLYQEPESKVSLVYANRNEESIIFKERIEKLQAQYAERFTVVHCLDNPPLQWQGPSGLLNPELLGGILDGLPDMGAENTEYYTCGPEGMMNNVLQTLEQRGVAKERTHKESFVAGTTSPKEKAPQPGAVLDTDDVATEAFEVKIILDDEEHVFTVQPEDTILETGLEQDIDMPYSCQSGLCTACRGKCLSGKVKLDENEGLSDEELEEGYVLTCVGHPLTPGVVIEIG